MRKISLELIIKIQNIQETNTGEEYRKLLRISFETIAWLYNLRKRLTS